MNKYKSFNVQIWCGLQEGYDKEKMHDIKEAIEICDRFVNNIKECVTVTPTSFRYVDGHEDGFVVGFINYPRFPLSKKEILNRATGLAHDLMYRLNQKRVTVTTPDYSYMFENEYFKN